MKITDRGAVVVGMEVHRRFSTVTARDAEGKVARRRRLEHEDRGQLRKTLAGRPRGTTVILESNFGREWMCEELEQAGLKPAGKSATGGRRPRIPEHPVHSTLKGSHRH